MSKYPNWKEDQSKRRRKILACLRDLEHPATVREIMIAVKASSTGTIQRDLEALEREGFVRHDLDN